MGNDYYVTNEHRVFADGRTVGAGEIFGYDEITRQYYDRYRLPVMHTETNFAQGPNGDEAVHWLWKEWANVLRVRNDGIPIVGFTWYSLTDQVDWDTALREDNGNVNRSGSTTSTARSGRWARPTASSIARMARRPADAERVPARPGRTRPAKATGRCGSARAGTSPRTKRCRRRLPTPTAAGRHAATGRNAMRFADKVAIVTGGAAASASPPRGSAARARASSSPDLDAGTLDAAPPAVRVAGAPDRSTSPATSLEADVARPVDARSRASAGSTSSSTTPA